ncbi:hypothetical protein AWT69_001892 [Pseudomonas putida]|nr:hypothetical protein AWT69_001892 [Pseudomonas putida]
MLDTELEDNRTFTQQPGMSYQPVPQRLSWNSGGQALM